MIDILYGDSKLIFELTIPSSATGTSIFSFAADVKIISSNGLV